MFSIPGLGKRDGGGIKGLLGGLLGGAALLLVATLVLFWNEGRTVKRTAVLAEGKALVQSVEAEAVDPANEGRLLHVRSELAATGRLLDPDFGVEAEGIALRRRVEMYQWQEKKSRQEGDKQGYDYRYEKTWSGEPIEHAGFDRPQGHENPAALPFPSSRWNADEVRLGAFSLGPDAINELSSWESVGPSMQSLPANLAASLRVEAGVLTSADSLDSPAIGDIRIRFDRVPLGRASVVAQQKAGRLEPFAVKQGELLLAQRGSVGSAALFDAAGSRNSSMGWALRSGGFMAFWIGFGLMLRPISGVLGSLPIIGGIGRMVTTVVAGLLALSLSLLTIVSGWLFYRPWLLIVFLGALAFAIIWLVRRPRAGLAAPVAQVTHAAAGSAPPPPPPPPSPPPG